MGLTARLQTPWKSIKPDKSYTSFRVSILRTLVVILVFSAAAYLLWLPIYYIFGAIGNLFSHHTQIAVPELGDDTIKHFAGSRDCDISQGDIYHVPWPTSPKTSPFCKNRATLIEALSGGGRHGFDEPYVGKGCTYRWFSTPEICMILERFNAVVFIGDNISQSIYTALNVLLREDLALGGLQQWMLSDQDRVACKCDNQFLNGGCLGYAIQASAEVKKNEAGDRKGSAYFCERVKHAYIPVDSTPASTISTKVFKDLTYGKPNPWQPSPMIFSFSKGSSFDTATATKALGEWSTLAAGAERNIPILFLGASALGLNKAATTIPKEGNAAVWRFKEQMAGIAKEKNFDVLSLYNLTVQASSVDGERFGQKVSLVEAMMVINWLSKLDTS